MPDQLPENDALRSKHIFRFVTNWDVGRWESDNETVHKVAMDNLANLPWPGRMERTFRVVNASPAFTGATTNSERRKARLALSLWLSP